MTLQLVFLLSASVAYAGADWEQQARALRPADTKAEETAVLDELQQRAKSALDRIHHARTLAEANQSRPILRKQLEASLGFRRLPWPPRLEAQVVGTVQGRGFRIEKIVFQSIPGVLVPAHLYLPDVLKGPAPAVLFYVGHWWPDAKTHPDFQAFCMNMARFGFVVLVWDPFGQGERGISWRDHRRVESLLVGLSQQGIAEYETRCALEYLLSRPEVDSARIGMTGASGGGFNTWVTSALDDRIQVAVPVVGTSEFYEQLSVSRPLDWDHADEHCHFVPGLLRYANNHEFASMVAPRALMIIAASQDRSFPIDGVRQVVDYTRGLYAGAHLSEKFSFFEDTSAGHGYQQKKREAAYGWFLKWLKHEGDGGPNLEISTETALFDDPDLQCFPPEQNPPAGPGIVAAVRRLADRKDRFPATTVKAPTPPKPHLAETRLQRLTIPVAPKLSIPAYLLRPAEKQRGILLVVDDHGKEAALCDPAVLQALSRGWAIYGVDPRGIGELATSQTGWLGAVSLLLGDYYVETQATDIRAAAEALRGQPLALYARGENAALAATLAIPDLPNLKWYVLRDGFLSYRQFLDRPASLAASYRLLAENKDRLTAFDHEIPLYFVPFQALRRPDLPDSLSRSRARGLIVNPLDGDWQRMTEPAARKLLPSAVQVVSSNDATVAEEAFIRSR